MRDVKVFALTACLGEVQGRLECEVPSTGQLLRRCLCKVFEIKRKLIAFIARAFANTCEVFRVT